jgi:hypothetical protein
VICIVVRADADLREAAEVGEALWVLYFFCSVDLERERRRRRRRRKTLRRSDRGIAAAADDAADDAPCSSSSSSSSSSSQRLAERVKLGEIGLETSSQSCRGGGRSSGGRRRLRQRQRRRQQRLRCSFSRLLHVLLFLLADAHEQLSPRVPSRVDQRQPGPGELARKRRRRRRRRRRGGKKGARGRDRDRRRPEELVAGGGGRARRWSRGASSFSSGQRPTQGETGKGSGIGVGLCFPGTEPDMEQEGR